MTNIKIEPNRSKNTAIKSVLAGGIAGGLEVLCTFPTEYIKTQLQLDLRSKNPRFNGPIDCLKKNISEFGFFGLYRGLSSLLYGSIPKSAIRFSVYDKCKSIIAQDGSITKSQSLFCGMIAGVTEAVVIVCPMETIKVIMINDQISQNPKYKGFFSGVKSIVAENGIRGVYKGIIPTILKQGSNQAIRFTVFDSLKKMVIESHPGQDISILETFMIGAIAGTVNVYANTPFDVIKTRLQGLDSHKYKGTWDCIRKIYTLEGPLTFYQGTVPRLARVSFDAAFQFTIYQEVMKLLNRIFK